MTNTEFLSQKITWANYQRMRLLLAGRISRELTQKTGLSDADFDILTALMESQAESVRAIALRCGLDWEKSRLSHQLRRMESRGLVSREECTEDNRGTVIRLTAKGRKLAQEATQYHQEIVNTYFYQVLTLEQLEALNQISEAILSELNSDPPRTHQK